MKRVTITAYAPVILQDVEGLEWQVPGAAGTLSVNADETKSFMVTDRTYDARIYPQLNQLAQERIPVPTTDTDTPRGRTRPKITFTVDDELSAQPMVDRVAGSPLSLATPLAVTLTGRNFIRGSAALVEYGTGTSKLTFTAVRKGDQGNLVRVRLMPGAASASISTTMNADGSVDIVITPTTAQQANLIAAQVTGLAAQFVSAVAGGTGKVAINPTAGVLLKLVGGRGQGVAWHIFPTVLGTSWLLIEGRSPGNSKNAISVKIIAEGAGAVTVSGNDITVEPVTGDIGAAEIATQINANAAAAALVRATATGTSDLDPVTVGKTYLHGGSGHDAVATIGGAAASFTTYTNTSIVLATTNGALVAAGVGATMLADVNVKAGPDVFGTQVHMDV